MAANRHFLGPSPCFLLFWSPPCPVFVASNISPRTGETIVKMPDLQAPAAIVRGGLAAHPLLEAFESNTSFVAWNTTKLASFFEDFAPIAGRCVRHELDFFQSGVSSCLHLFQADVGLPTQNSVLRIHVEFLKSPHRSSELSYDAIRSQRKPWGSAGTSGGSWNSLRLPKTAFFWLVLWRQR